MWTVRGLCRAFGFGWAFGLGRACGLRWAFGLFLLPFVVLPTSAWAKAWAQTCIPGDSALWSDPRTPPPSGHGPDGGQELTIARIEFTGNENFSALVLTEQLVHRPTGLLTRISGLREATVFDPDCLEEDVRRIEAFYQYRGYRAVAVRSAVMPAEVEGRVVLRFIIREGMPVVIRSVRIDVDAPQEEVDRISASDLFVAIMNRQPYRNGQPLHEGNRSEALAMFTAMLRELGYAFAEVDMTVEPGIGHQDAAVAFRLMPGPRTRIASLDVAGAETVNAAYVIRQSGLRPGDTFSLRDTESARGRLRSHHLFSSAAIEVPEQPEDGTLDLLIRVEERPLRSLRLSGGVGSEDVIRGGLSWETRNVNGRAHRFSSSAEASFVEQRIAGEYYVPYLLNNRSSYAFTPFLEHAFGPRRAYELFRAGVRQSMLYQPSPWLNGSLNHELSYNEELSNRSNPRLPDSLLAYNVSAYSLTGHYTGGFQRGEGWVLSGFAEVSSPFGLSDYRYQKLSFDLRRFQRTGLGSMVATRIEGGAILFADSDSLPTSILFFNGGTQTVRGWSRESLGPKRAVLDSTADGGTRFGRYVPTGGRIMVAASAELRHRLRSASGGQGWEMAWFIDAGQVWRKMDDVTKQRIRVGIGTGVRYDSPIGPVRVDVAWKVNPSDEDLDVYEGVRYGSWRNRFGLHFSLGGPF